MRIAIVSIIREPWGGSEELWADLAREALAAGHEVHISALNCGSIHPKTTALLNAGAHLHFRRGYIKPGIPAWQRIIRKLANIVANKLQNPFHRLFSQRPDVVFYVGTAYSISSDHLLLKALQKWPAALYINCQLNSVLKGFGETNYDLVKAAYQQAREVLFVSEENLVTARRHTCSAIANGTVVRNPVNLAATSIIPFPAGNTLQFAMVGMLLADHKGQDQMLDVLHSEKWKARDWHLNIYGAGPDGDYMKRLCTFYGLDNKVTFHGKVNDIRKVWHENALLLMPSHQEGMPLAVVEAMVCGRPVLATDVGGHREWITDGENGFISPGVTVHSLAETMETAWLRRNDWRQMGEIAHNTAMRLYDPTPGKTVLHLLLNHKA